MYTTFVINLLLLLFHGRPNLSSKNGLAILRINWWQSRCVPSSRRKVTSVQSSRCSSFSSNSSSWPMRDLILCLKRSARRGSFVWGAAGELCSAEHSQDILSSLFLKWHRMLHLFAQKKGHCGDSLQICFVTKYVLLKRLPRSLHYAFILSTSF